MIPEPPPEVTAHGGPKESFSEYDRRPGLSCSRGRWLCDGRCRQQHDGCRHSADSPEAAISTNCTISKPGQLYEVLDERSIHKNGQIVLRRGGKQGRPQAPCFGGVFKQVAGIIRVHTYTHTHTSTHSHTSGFCTGHIVASVVDQEVVGELEKRQRGRGGTGGGAGGDVEREQEEGSECSEEAKEAN